MDASVQFDHSILGVSRSRYDVNLFHTWKAPMTPNTDRVISISLPDEVWRAFTQANPEPISWLKARIQESIDSARNTATGNRPPVGRA